MEIMLQVEGRNMRMKLKGRKLADLEAAFEVMCAKDPVLKLRVQTHFATFKSYDKVYNLDVEIQHGDTIQRNQVVKVYFASYAALDDQQEPAQPNEGGGLESYASVPGTSGTTSRSTSHSTLNEVDDTDDSAFLKLMGVHQKSNIKISTQNASKTATPVSVNRSKSQEIHVGSDSDENNEYVLSAMRAREQNQQQLVNLNIEKPTLKGKKKVNKKKATGKENVQPVRVMPTRAVKALALINRQKSQGSSDEIDCIDEDLLLAMSDDGDAGPLVPNTHQAKQKVSKQRRKPNKRVRLCGEKITRSTILPLFPIKLVQCLGQVYRNQCATAEMNNFLKAHILDITKDLYPTTEEYQILKEQIVSRLKMMKVADVSFYENRFKESLSASLRAARSHENNRKPRMQEARKSGQSTDALESTQGTSTAPERQIHEHDENFNGTSTAPKQQLDQVDEHDEILKKPVLNKETVKLALATSTRRTAILKKVSVVDALAEYPYLKVAELLICHYCVRVPMIPEEASSNFESCIAPVAAIFKSEVPTTELEKIKLFKLIDKHYSDSTKEDWPCILFCDDHHRNDGLLDKVPRGQAPALVIFQNDRDITSAVLVFDGQCITTLRKPLAYQSLQLLLSGYFVFHLEYPKAYQLQLDIFEAILHAKKQWPRRTKDFYLKLKEEKEKLQ